METLEVHRFLNVLHLGEFHLPAEVLSISIGDSRHPTFSGKLDVLGDVSYKRRSAPPTSIT